MAIEHVPANRRSVEELYAHGYLTAHARRAALEFLNPHNQWGLWISRLFLVFGCALVLSGVVYFFAYNWNLIPPAAKFATIQIAAIAAVAAACWYGLTRVSGKTLMIAASVFVGVFLAVFGQVYQTGADAYQLFLAWSLLILGWSVLSNFAPQWTLWLAVTNVALVLWWEQAALPTYEMDFLIFGYLALFNGLALALREWGALRGVDWIAPLWTRQLLALITLGVLLIPVLWMVMGSGVRTSVLVTGMIGLIGLFTLYAIYRHVLQDIWALAATVLSGCLIASAAAYRVLGDAFGDFPGAIWLSRGLVTLLIFSAAIVYLRSVTKTRKAAHG